MCLDEEPRQLVGVQFAALCLFCFAVSLMMTADRIGAYKGGESNSLALKSHKHILCLAAITVLLSMGWSLCSARAMSAALSSLLSLFQGALSLLTSMAGVSTPAQTRSGDVSAPASISCVMQL